jgi:hypothetical protein
MQGGISWHLTREMLGDDVVMAGPNPFNGQSRVLKIDGTSKYFNDALSEDDKYILCGGHHSKVGHETTILYWWPKPSVWAASGFNLGYWSEVAEDWFRHRRGEIWNGMASPQTNKHWKNVLARYKHSRMFMDKIENVSTRFVSEEKFGQD